MALELILLWCAVAAIFAALILVAYVLSDIHAELKRQEGQIDRLWKLGKEIMDYIEVADEDLNKALDRTKKLRRLRSQPEKAP